MCRQGKYYQTYFINISGSTGMRKSIELSESSKMSGGWEEQRVSDLEETSRIWQWSCEAVGAC